VTNTKKDILPTAPIDTKNRNLLLTKPTTAYPNPATKTANQNQVFAINAASRLTVINQDTHLNENLYRIKVGGFSGVLHASF